MKRWFNLRLFAFALVAALVCAPCAAYADEAITTPSDEPAVETIADSGEETTGDTATVDAASDETSDDATNETPETLSPEPTNLSSGEIENPIDRTVVEESVESVKDGAETTHIDETPTQQTADESTASAKSEATVTEINENLTATQPATVREASALTTQAPPSTVSEGAYVIKPKATYGSALSVAGNRNASAIATAGIDGDYDQVFYFQSNGSGLFSIFSVFSGLALDASGSEVRQASYSGSNHQLFEARMIGNGYALVSKAGRALVVSGNSLKAGAYDKNAPGQRFSLVEAPLVIPGVQVLYASSAPSSAIGVAGSSRSSGTVATASAYAGEEGQKMTMVRSSSGYAVKPLSSGLGFAPSGDNVVQHTSSSTWNVKFATSGSRRGITLVAASTSKAMQVSGSSIKMATQNGSTAQAFLPAKANLVTAGCYVIQNLAGSTVLEVEGGSWANGSNVALHASNGTGAQMFDIKSMGSALFQITNAMTGYAVSASSDNVYQYSYIGAYDQLWVPVASSGGGLMWVNAATGKALNATSTTPGANASAASPNNSKAQSWTLAKSSYESDPVLQTAMWHVNNSSSATNYQIMVDRNNCRTVVAEKSGGVWRPIFNWTCSPGAPSTPTVGGDYTVTGKGYSFSGALGGTPYTCYYYTQFWGDYLFHSIPYYQGTWIEQDNRLGQMLSHGCVRLATDNAKWLYDNIPYSTHVYIYN